MTLAVKKTNLNMRFALLKSWWTTKTWQTCFVRNATASCKESAAKHYSSDIRRLFIALPVASIEQHVGEYGYFFLAETQGSPRDTPLEGGIKWGVIKIFSLRSLRLCEKKNV